MWQKEFTLSKCYQRFVGLVVALQTVSKRYLNRRSNNPVFGSTFSVLYIAATYAAEQQQTSLLLNRAGRIASIDFMFNFNRFSDKEALERFRFRLVDIIKIVPFIAWPMTKTHTNRNRYGVNQILATCIVLRRMAVPDRWVDLEDLFGKHSSQPSEIFWEAIEHFVSAQGHLILQPIPHYYMQTRAKKISAAIHAKRAALPNCVGFIDGTVIGFAHPKGNMQQMVVYNGHKRKHALKYQAVTTPDGMIVHAHGPMEGRRHDRFLYLCSGVESNLSEILLIDGVQYVIYGEPGYNWRSFTEIPFQGSNLDENQAAFNTSMSRVRITVEWIFKKARMYFPIVDMKRKMKLWESPIGLLYIATMLLCNSRNAIYPNPISEYFGCIPTPLDEYISGRSHGVS